MMLFTVVWSQVSSAGQISGELKKWHKVTLTFNGPETSETAKPNPFGAYRQTAAHTAKTTNGICFALGTAHITAVFGG